MFVGKTGWICLRICYCTSLNTSAFTEQLLLRTRHSRSRKTCFLKLIFKQHFWNTNSPLNTPTTLRIGPEVNEFQGLGHSLSSSMNSPSLLASSTKEQKQTFILWISSALQVERAPRSLSDLYRTIPGLGLSDTEFSQSQGPRTHCTEDKSNSSFRVRATSWPHQSTYSPNLCFPKAEQSGGWTIPGNVL